MSSTSRTRARASGGSRLRRRRPTRGDRTPTHHSGLPLSCSGAPCRLATQACSVPVLGPMAVVAAVVVVGWGAVRRLASRPLGQAKPGLKLSLYVIYAEVGVRHTAPHASFIMDDAAGFRSMKPGTGGVGAGQARPEQLRPWLPVFLAVYV